MENLVDLYAVSKVTFTFNTHVIGIDTIKVNRGSIVKYKIGSLEEDGGLVSVYIYRDDDNEVEREIIIKFDTENFNSHFDIIGDFNAMVDYTRNYDLDR